MAVRRCTPKIGRALVAVEAGVVALVLLSCGETDRADPEPSPPARLAEPDEGDERPIAVRVRVTVTDDAITVAPRRVAAFLPLRFAARNRGARRAFVRLPGVPAVLLDPGTAGAERSAGLQPGRYTVRAGDRRARLRVVAGG